MSIILPFLSGFVAAVIGIFPPGLINMTAAKVSLSDGRKRALIFVAGALIIILLQTYVSVLFARYINANEDVVLLLREVGFGIFTALSLYFLFMAKKSNPNTETETLHLKSKRSRFFMGMLISALNFFPIPYYVIVSITLASYKLFTFESGPIYGLVLGAVSGSFLVFYSYVVFFDKIKSKTDYFIRNMNTIIGGITGIVALITLFNILNYYFGS